MPRLQHLLALGMLLIEGVAFGFLSDSYTVAVVACLAGFLTLATPWRVPLRRSQRFVASLALAVPFTFQWVFAPYEPQHLQIFIMYALAHAGGQYGLALQTGYLWVKQPQEPWSPLYPLCGVCVLIAAADVQTTRWQSNLFQIAVLMFVLLTACYYSAAQITIASRHRVKLNGRRIWQVGTILVTCAISLVASRWLERSWTTIERIYTEWMMPNNSNSSVGFARQARLGNTSDQNSPRNQMTALRVYAAEEPGYLRGAAYTVYTNGIWTNDALRLTITPEAPPSLPKTLPDSAKYYRLPNADPAPPASSSASTWTTLEVWPTAAIGADAAFCTLEAEWLAINQTKLEIDAHGIAYPDGSHPDASTYSLARRPPAIVHGFEEFPEVTGTTSLKDPPDLNLRALTAVPEDLDPRIRKLAQTIFAEATTTESKLQEVSRWFKKNYHYELGMQVPLGRDPLTHFLIARPGAHCEYFATGTVVLLRLANVPCRYVTGFVVTEYNYFGGYWIARNKDAHAWVEAWIPGRGWITVESTPARGIPHAEQSVSAGHLWDDLLMRVQMLRAQLTQGTLTGLLQAGGTVLRLFFTTPHGWLMLTGLVIWGIVLWRRHVHFTFRRKYDPIAAEFHTLLGQLDQQLRAWQLSRPNSETLTQFARRLAAHPSPAIHAAADWYQTYAEIRYRTDSIPAEIHVLKSRLPGILQDLRSSLRVIRHG